MRKLDPMAVLAIALGFGIGAGAQTADAQAGSIFQATLAEPADAKVT